MVHVLLESSGRPTHRRDRCRRADPGAAERPDEADRVLDLTADAADGSDRTRRIRDAVEAALSDIILLGTEAHVRLAATAAGELVAGRLVHARALVVSLRDFLPEPDVRHCRPRTRR